MVNPMIAMARRRLERARNRRLLEIAGPGTIREERFMPLGSIPQWVTIRGHDVANPLLLILQGGPGSSYTPFNPWLGSWEREFTVVQWDQRGAGKTFLRTRTAPALSLERLVADGIELAEALAERFTGPIVLMGSSVGSLLGAIMAKRRPELFSSYLAANVFTNESGDEGYGLVIEAAKRRGNRRAVRDLSRLGPHSRLWSPEESLAFSKTAITLSDGVPDMVYDLMLPALMYSPDYSMGDIRILEKGMTLALHELQPEYRDYSFDTLGWEYEIPVTIVQGEGDLISPVVLARRHFDRIVAPQTRFVTVPGAGHLVEFAARDQFLTVLKGTTSGDLTDLPGNQVDVPPRQPRGDR
ncbi:alpha/beta hydrolase [Planctomonas sp. JC2975]|uniref:alpha/beta fold hydrolase n=1 Tax=Planctomonas sp. JC2975 TaxID=2729626 RepID=UPI00147372AD|nr:alpha/beta hydrolase [Planctomonas sp. JC2975]NNC11098.1 alpha/beta hydrolase [Planctomonas sp. JC2975]